MSDVAIVQVVTFLTVVAGFLYQAYERRRQRAWDMEDRKQLVETVSQAATEVTEVKEKTSEVKKTLDVLHEQINGKMEKLLEQKGIAAHAEGKAEGVEAERSRPNP